MLRAIVTFLLVAGGIVQAHAQTTQPATAVVEWVKQNAIPLKTSEAGNGFADMRPLKQLIGDARVVGLGEPTHGTREVFQMKHRFLEFLASEMGFTLFGIEASMPDCAAINEYVLHGTGDPETAVAGQGFWTWSTEEVLGMVKWMRAYNVDPANASRPKLKFWGFDMQHPPSAVNGALVYLKKVDADAAKQFEPPVQLVFTKRPLLQGASEQEIESLRASLNAMAQHMDAQRGAYIQRSSKDEFIAARRCVDVALQGIELAEEMRAQSSSIGRQREMMLFTSVPSAAKELLAHQEQTGSEVAFHLLRQLQNLQGFSMRYNQAGEQERDDWDAQAAALRESITDDAKLAKAADDVILMLKVLREYAAKPDRDSTDNVRDRYMAENTKWILEQEGPDARIVCWAHNGHLGVARPEPGKGVMTQGSYLRKMFGDDYVVIGFSFNRGSFQAVAAPRTGETGLRGWTVGPAKEGSIDATLAAAGIPLFILDLRKQPDGPVAQWFNTEHPMRMAGALFDPAVEDTQYYAPIDLAKTYDAIIFMDETTRARPLKAMPHASLDPASAMMLSKPRLGVRLEEAEPDRPGVVILEFLPDSAAERAGLRAKDRILKIGEVEIRSVPMVREALMKFDEGATVPVTVERDGQTMTIDVAFPKRAS